MIQSFITTHHFFLFNSDVVGPNTETVDILKSCLFKLTGFLQPEAVPNFFLPAILPL